MARARPVRRTRKGQVETVPVPPKVVAAGIVSHPSVSDLPKARLYVLLHDEIARKVYEECMASDDWQPIYPEQDEAVQLVDNGVMCYVPKGTPSLVPRRFFNTYIAQRFGTTAADSKYRWEQRTCALCGRDSRLCSCVLT